MILWADSCLGGIEVGYLLDDITVIDAATFLAGPGAATIMADFGANVIKIEPPGGDGYRQLAGNAEVPYHWLLTSRNKKSLALDLTKDAGKALMHALIAKADVLTTNFLQPALERYELEYERVKSVNPKLVYAHMSGYGMRGPEVSRRAFDITAWWGRSGLMEFVRDPGQTPLQPAPGMGDHSTATAMFGAIMTGLYRREKTGEGCQVSTSLSANGVWANGMALQGVIAGTDLGQHRQEKGWINPFMSAYASSDGAFVVLAIPAPMKEWAALCNAMGHPEWQQDERFADQRTIMRNRRELLALIAEAAAKFTFDELMERLDSHDVTCGPVQPMAAILEDEQLRANDIVIETGDQGEGYDLTINSPINVLEETKKPPERAPDVGANSVEVLQALGFDDAYIGELLAAKVVLGPR